MRQRKEKRPIDPAQDPEEEVEPGALIAFIRWLRGWLQKDLAREAGMDPSQISRYEAGDDKPRPANMDRILEAGGLRYPLAAAVKSFIRLLRRAGEGAARQFRPLGVFRDRAVALLFAAVLPGTGRDLAFRLRKDAEGVGYGVESPADQVIGYLALFEETLVAAAHTAECLVRQPQSLAHLLEAAGGLALERSGAILDARVSGSGPDCQSPR